MRSIITSTVVLLAIVGFVNAQNRRLNTNFDLSEYQDLVSTGMGITKAADLIDNICRGTNRIHIFGAINVETNETMKWSDYKKGPGINGDPELNFAIYPWSVVGGRCIPLLNSTWATDREVFYGPYVNNTYWHTRPMSLDTDLVVPKSNVTTTLKSWERSIRDPPDIKRSFFDRALQNASEYLGNSMLWNPEDQMVDTRRPIAIDGCTQSRLTAVSVMRTMIAVNAFQLEKYYWCIRRRRKWVFWRWETVQEGIFDVWMDVEGIVVPSAMGDEWKTVYSSGGYMRVDGLSLMIPGRTMIGQIEDWALPPQECSW
jgi:hypothetical protein